MRAVLKSKGEFFMPKNKFQEIIFTILMVFVMVYAMVCYNIALNTGGMSNAVFLAAFRELPIMMPIAFILDFFLVGNLAKKAAFRMVDVKTERPFHLILAISAVSVAWMCPLMSLAATILFQHPGKQIISMWLQTTVFAGPLVRFVFGRIFREKATAPAVQPTVE